MSTLRPQYIVVHTAAFGGRNCDRDMIDGWHRERGWNGIGYHYVLINDKHDTIEDGTIQSGRDIHTIGAHAKGLNSRSIGICCIGHGDEEPFTHQQTESLVALISDLIDEHENITVDHVIGHRELNKLVANGLLSSEYKTSKSCPGSKVDMEALRELVRNHREVSSITAEFPEFTGTQKQEVITALNLLEETAAAFSNARDELKEFLTHPEVIAFRDNG